MHGQRPRRGRRRPPPAPCRRGAGRGVRADSARAAHATAADAAAVVRSAARRAGSPSRPSGGGRSSKSWSSPGRRGSPSPRSSQLGSPDALRRQLGPRLRPVRIAVLLAAGALDVGLLAREQARQPQATAWGVATFLAVGHRPARLLHPLLPDQAAHLMARKGQTHAARASRSRCPPPLPPEGGRSGSSSPRRSASTGTILPDAPARALGRGADAADRRRSATATTSRAAIRRRSDFHDADVDARRRDRDDDPARRAAADRVVHRRDRPRHRGEADGPALAIAYGARRARLPAGAAARAAARACPPSPTSRFFGWVVPAALVEGTGFRDSLPRGRSGSRGSTTSTPLGGLATLVIVFYVVRLMLALLLADRRRGRASGRRRCSPTSCSRRCCSSGRRSSTSTRLPASRRGRVSSGPDRGGVMPKYVMLTTLTAKGVQTLAGEPRAPEGGQPGRRGARREGAAPVGDDRRLRLPEHRRGARRGDGREGLGRARRAREREAPDVRADRDRQPARPAAE